MSDIIIEEHDDYCILYLQGRFFGNEETDKLAEYFARVFEAGKHLIVEMSGVSFLSSLACSA